MQQQRVSQAGFGQRTGINVWLGIEWKPVTKKWCYSPEPEDTHY